MIRSSALFCSVAIAVSIVQTLIVGTAYTCDTAEAEPQRGIAKLVAFGSSFLANPDLPECFRQNVPLNTPDCATMFDGGEKGYIDSELINGSDTTALRGSFL